MKIVKILEEIKELDMIMEKMITIKLMNSLNSLFKIYPIILSQKVRDNNKLLDLQAFLSNLKDKKRYMKQTTKVNLTQSQYVSSDSILLKSDSSLCTQDS